MIRRLVVLLVLAGCQDHNTRQAVLPESTSVSQPVEIMPWDTMTTTPADTTPALVFVIHDEADATIMLPLLAVDSGEMQRPPDDSIMVRHWYSWGTRFRLLRGNVQTGSVAVIRAGEQNQCNPTPAYIRYYEEGERPQRALATNSGSLGGRTFASRDVTPQERQLLDGIAARLIRDSLAWQGNTFPLAPSDARAIAVDSSSQPSLLAMYGMQTDSGYVSLFMLLAHTQSWYEVTLALAHRSDPDDGRDWPVWEFVDVIDLDLDGIAELVVAVTGIESTSYEVYQRGDELWREAFSGALLMTC